MTKDVKIKIEGSQIGAEDEPVITEVNGRYHINQNKHYVSYTEETEDGPVNAMIKISPDFITIRKNGVYEMDMEYRLGELTSTSYRTPYGIFHFQVYTSGFHVTESPEEINVRLSYSLLDHADVISQNHLQMSILSLDNL